MTTTSYLLFHKSYHLWRLEPKKRKPAIFDQMDHRQANTSRKKWKMKLRSVPRGEADDHERPFKEYSQLLQNVASGEGY